MNPTWITPEVSNALVGMQWGFLAYFICINVVYLALNFIAMFAILRYAREHSLWLDARIIWWTLGRLSGQGAN